MPPKLTLNLQGDDRATEQLQAPSHQQQQGGRENANMSATFVSGSGLKLKLASGYIASTHKVTNGS